MLWCWLGIKGIQRLAVIPATWMVFKLIGEVCFSIAFRMVRSSTGRGLFGGRSLHELYAATTATVKVALLWFLISVPVATRMSWPAGGARNCSRGEMFGGGS